MVLLPTAKGFKPTKLNFIWYDMIWYVDDANANDDATANTYTDDDDI